jgi:anti-sigma factor RsiW
MREEDSKTPEDGKTAEGAALWRQAREGWRRPADVDAPDALLLAAYLDGRLHEDEAGRLEARLAGEPALLDELLALRESLAVGPEAAPAPAPAPVLANVVARAQGLRPATVSPRPMVAVRPSLAERLFGFSLRPAVSALAGLALLLACAGAFELGRYQSERFDTTQTAEVSDADLPVDLLMDGLL